MIHINPHDINFDPVWEAKARELTNELLKKTPDERAAFIDSKRVETWGNEALLKSLRAVVGNKCWYSEVSLEGFDPNIDHFRPKGRVVEIDNNTLEKTKAMSPGYWWLAFEPKNFRLSCMHANQRRVDEETEGGKGDFFPVEGARAPEGTEWDLIAEDVLPFDPCCAMDMALLWFSSDGTPTLKNSSPSDEEKRRLDVTVWLFHLNKAEIAEKRTSNVIEIMKDVKAADAAYKIWKLPGATSEFVLKKRFDDAVAKIKSEIKDTKPFARARQCAVLLARAQYSWIAEYVF